MEKRNKAGIIYNIIKYTILVTMKDRLGYKTSLFSECIIFVSAYFALILFNRSGLSSMYHQPEFYDHALLIIGFIYWNLGVVAMGWSSQAIEDDAKTGILELKMQSSIPFVLLNVIETFVALIINVLLIFVLTAITCVFSGYSPLVFMKIIAAVLVSIPSIVGMCGIGLIIGGIAISEKRVGAFLMIFQGILLFVSNSTRIMISPFEMVLPFTLGTEMSRSMLLNKSVPTYYIVVYFLVNIIWFVIGTYSFKYFLQRERKVGSFSTY